MCGRIYLFSGPAEVAGYTGARGPTPNTEGGEMDVAPPNDLTALRGALIVADVARIPAFAGLFVYWSRAHARTASDN